MEKDQRTGKIAWRALWTLTLASYDPSTCRLL